MGDSRTRAAARRVARFAAAIVALALVVAPPAVVAQAPGTLRVAFEVAETGFDPQAINDNYSFMVCDAIFDALYTYDYFARPPRLVPNTAASLPEITDGGRTFTIRLRSGIRFASDPAFRGKPRELTAADYVYSFKRILDPRVRSQSLFLLEHRLLGADEALAKARRANALDYDAPIEGLQALDRYTLRIRFREPNFVFRHWLTYVAFGAVAREVVEAHRDASNRVMDHPVGTGAYRLAQWTRGRRIVLEANPDFRDERFPAPGEGSEPGDDAIARGLVGRRLPLVPRVEIDVVEEAQPRLLMFDSGRLDYLEVPASIATRVLAGDALKPDLARRGIALHRFAEPALSYVFFNLDDPVVGGHAPEKLALRRALALAYDRTTLIRTLRNGQGRPATQLAAAGLVGYDPSLPVRDEYDPAAAKALLDRFGYKDRDGDGYRETPGGKPLTIVLGSTTTAESRARDELWKRNLDAIGVRTTFVKQTWPELNRMAEAGQLMAWGLGAIASIPDADAFYSLLYGGNVGLGNYARMRLPAYDALYARTQVTDDERERVALFRQMNELVHAHAPWILGVNPQGNVLAQPWLRGFKPDPVLRYPWKFYDVAPR